MRESKTGQKASQDKSCELCPRNLDCSNLYTALKLLPELAAKSKDKASLQRYEAFKRHLKHLKFDFPDGHVPCLLSHDPKLVRELVATSIELITSFQSHGEASGRVS